MCSTEAKGKVVLPPQYVKFRQLLVDQGITFTERWDCCVKGCVLSRDFLMARV